MTKPPRRKRQAPPFDPEEVIARALCRADPEAQTPKGPLWSSYRKDARKVVEALGGRLIGDSWSPTPDAINALPERLREYVHHLETHADPNLTIQQLWEAREQVAQLEALLQAERKRR